MGSSRSLGSVDWEERERESEEGGEASASASGKASSCACVSVGDIVFAECHACGLKWAKLRSSRLMRDQQPDDRSSQNVCACTKSRQAMRLTNKSEEILIHGISVVTVVSSSQITSGTALSRFSHSHSLCDFAFSGLTRVAESEASLVRMS